MSYFEARPRAVGAATARAIACKASRQRWHLRQSRHCRICNLQNVKRPGGFEPDPHWVAKTGPASRCTDEPVAEIVQCGEPFHKTRKSRFSHSKTALMNYRRVAGQGPRRFSWYFWVAAGAIVREARDCTQIRTPSRWFSKQRFTQHRFRVLVNYGNVGWMRARVGPSNPSLLAASEIASTVGNPPPGAIRLRCRVSR